MAVKDWSTTPALNATQPGINFATGAAPSTVHPSARQMMADIASAGIAISVTAFGADPTGVTDSTDAFNLATAAASVHGGNTTILKRIIKVPAGTYKLGTGTNKTVFVRKGQTLDLESGGAVYIDCSGAVSNTAPIFMLGTKSDGTVDPGGLIAEVKGGFFFGGPSAFAVIDTSQVAGGYLVENGWFNAPGIGVYAGGGDGRVSGCTFDLGQAGIVLGGQNNVVESCRFFNLTSYDVQVVNGYDMEINNCHSEYNQAVSIIVASTVTGVRRLTIRDHVALMNGQYVTSLSSILIQGAGATVDIFNPSISNIASAAIYVDSAGSTVNVKGGVIDGLRSNPAYTQSTAMQGIVCVTGDVDISGVKFQNLGGQPITIGGAAANRRVVQACSFANNTGGTTEVALTNSNSASRVIIDACVGSGRALLNYQATVPALYLPSNSDGVFTGATVASAATITLPYGYRSIIIGGTTGITSITPELDRMVTLVFTAALTVTNGSNLKIGSNYTSAANGTLTLSCPDGANWYQVARV